MKFKEEEIKSAARSLGADRCGISSAERFAGAPAGFHPRDIFKNCSSVVVFLKRMPPGSILMDNAVIYTHTAEFLYKELDRIGMALCYILEKQGINTVPVPTDVPYMHWEPERMHGMGILSIRHSAYTPAQNAG